MAEDKAALGLAMRFVDEAGSGKRGRGRIELLEKIAELGSISAAAKALGLSYKSAWEAVEAMNNLSDTLLVERVSGGRHGGGTVLTPRGIQVLAAFRRFEEEYSKFLAALRSNTEFGDFYQMIRGLGMKTSARNEFLGRVKQVKEGAVNAEVVLDIGGGQELVSIITNESVRNLELAVGKEAYALIKAPWVIVTAAEPAMKTSARNTLCGVVSRCQEGAVNGEVIIELPSGKSVAAIITNESIKNLGLREGVPACALIKASHIILAVPA